MNTFHKKLVLVLADRFFLAVALLAAGIFLDRKLEDYRSTRAYKEAIAVKRIDVITDLWRKIYPFEFQCTDAMQAIDTIFAGSYQNPVQFNQAMETQYTPKAEILQRSTVEVFKEIDKRRFWLGEDISREFRGLVLSRDTLVAEKLHRQDEAFKKTWEEMSAHRHEIDTRTRNLF